MHAVLLFGRRWHWLRRTAALVKLWSKPNSECWRWWMKIVCSRSGSSLVCCVLCLVGFWDVNGCIVLYSYRICVQFCSWQLICMIECVWMFLFEVFKTFLFVRLSQERLRDNSIRLQNEEKTTVKTHEQLVKTQAHARLLEEKLRASELKVLGLQQQLQSQQSQIHVDSGGAGSVTRLQAEIEVKWLVEFSFHEHSFVLVFWFSCSLIFQLIRLMVCLRF